jgi:hypothetical protein
MATVRVVNFRVKSDKRTELLEAAARQETHRAIGLEPVSGLAGFRARDGEYRSSWSAFGGTLLRRSSPIPSLLNCDKGCTATLSTVERNYCGSELRSRTSAWRSRARVIRTTRRWGGDTLVNIERSAVANVAAGKSEASSSLR